MGAPPACGGTTPRFAALAITTGPDGGEPLRPASRRWRSPRGPMVVTRCAPLRGAGDHHGARWW
ncbi:hypothetical protein BST16_06100 [Mycobacterium asiaticum DSM 44297]|nr:hypothetical protein BST16_06100 [Mycobacterium asiaticum DSM 44297]